MRRALPSFSLAALGVVVLLVASCGGGGGAPATAPRAPAALGTSSGARPAASTTAAGGPVLLPPKPAPAIVGPEGGTVALPDGTSVWIPHGALASPQTITIAPAPSSPAPPDATAVGATYAFGPEGVVFAKPVTVTLAYDPARLPKNKRAPQVTVYTGPAGSAPSTPLPTTRLDATHVEARTTHFSILGPVTPNADEAFDGPYKQFDIFQPASMTSYAKQAPGIAAEDWPPTTANLPWPDAPWTEGWNQEVCGVPFKWQNQSQNLLSDGNGTAVYDADGNWVRGAKGDVIVFNVGKPRRATHVELIVTTVFGHVMLKGAVMGRVEVTYEDDTLEKIDLVLGKNVRNNHFVLPGDAAARSPMAQFTQFVSETTDYKNVCEFKSGPLSSIHYAIDRVKLPLAKENVHARKRVKKILIRNLPHQVLLPDVSNTPAPVVSRPEYTGLQLYGVTIGKEYPAIVIPGILGTAISNGSPVDADARWPTALLSPTADSLESLGFRDDGTPNDPTLKECALLGQVPWQRGSGIFDFYHGLVSFMEDDMGYRLASNEPSPWRVAACWRLPAEPVDKGSCGREDLYTFPYDWRYSPEKATEKLRDLVKMIKTRTGAEKVDIIAHSLGGIVSRLYLAQGGAKDVDTWITLGTPFYGAPKVFSMIRFGDKEAPINETVQRVGLKRLARNLWGEYVLQPSAAYFDVAGRYYTYDGHDIHDASGRELGGWMSYDTMSAWIGAMPCSSDFFYPAWPGSSRNPCTRPDAPLYNADLVAWARKLHEQIDHWDLTGEDAPWKYAVLGTGFPTIVTMIESAVRGADGTITRKAVAAGCASGDGSVAPASALGFAPSVRKKVFIKAEHPAMANDETVQKQVQLLIPGIEENAPGASDGPMEAPGVCEWVAD